MGLAISSEIVISEHDPQRSRVRLATSGESGGSELDPEKGEVSLPPLGGSSGVRDHIPPDSLLGLMLKHGATIHG